MGILLYFGRGEQAAHPHTSGFSKKITGFRKGRFRPYEGPKLALRRAILWCIRHGRKGIVVEQPMALSKDEIGPY